MSKMIDRTALGAFAFLFAVAVADVSVARAQTSGPSILPTACGSGVLTECAQQKTYHCDWKIGFNFTTLPVGGGFYFYEVCTESGSRPIYKDRLAPATSGTCSVPTKPLGPPGEPQVADPDYQDDSCYE